MEVGATTQPASEGAADTVAIGVFDGETPDPGLAAGALAALLDSGEARPSFKHLAVTHAGDRRWLLVGLGQRDKFDAERARVVAGVVHARAKELSTRSLCWQLPSGVDDSIAAGLVEGTLLAAYVFDRYKGTPAGEADEEDADARRRLNELMISADHDVLASVEPARVEAEAQNAARDLQNTPANELTPSRLGERALELAAEIEGLTAEVEGGQDILARKMGAFAAVAQGSDQEPALITLRYEASTPRGPRLGFVGKAVTFDTGGISLKPSAKMSEMKFDMSGGAAVIEAIGAIARLRLPLSVIAVVGATENMPSGRAMKPGDIVRASNGTTIEINNTDAEGRLVLADCLAYAISEGAERVVDLATLTGAIIVSLGSTHAGLMSNDDAWAESVEQAARRSGELVWRLPLHPEYAEIIKGQYADINNAPEGRKASSITAAEFLQRFVGDTPWAHVDIAGTAWDLGRPYAAKAGSGFGVRLLVELARAQTAS